jgi:hypothetical protein
LEYEFVVVVNLINSVQFGWTMIMTK